ncbi:hypothetical protein [Tahibacter caeni]|uniref:hypothetical protein n=1 Tax=Tahibacter caeni TaxID=1453545 RepID=UPI00214753C0|nr:hypothetical protein [Tahibacter caeni]
MSQDSLELAHSALELLDTAHTALLRLCGIAASEPVVQALVTVGDERGRLLRELGLDRPDPALACGSGVPLPQT